MSLAGTSTQVRYFLRDDGTSVGQLAHLESMLKEHKFEHEEVELFDDATHPLGDLLALTIYCTSVAEIARLGKLLVEFESED